MLPRRVSEFVTDLSLALEQRYVRTVCVKLLALCPNHVSKTCPKRVSADWRMNINV